MNAKVSRDFKKDGRVVDTDEMLRPINSSHTHCLPNASNCVLLFSNFVYYYYLQPS